jgi:peptidoglycan hydrolase CwlO-like protein
MKKTFQTLILLLAVCTIAACNSSNNSADTESLLTETTSELEALNEIEAQTEEIEEAIIELDEIIEEL